MENKQLSKNFSLQELIKSETAAKNKISNIPDETSLKNLERLATEVLQPIRDKYGYPIRINSAYRGPKLNSLVGGSKTSSHMVGLAADIRATSGSNAKLFTLIKKMIESGEIEVSQLIWEYGTKKEPQWVHVAATREGKKKNQILYLGVK